MYVKCALIKLTPLHLWLMEVEREATNCADKCDCMDFQNLSLKAQELNSILYPHMKVTLTHYPETQII